MVDVFITVRGFYALASMFEEEAVAILYAGKWENPEVAQAMIDELTRKAEHCRNQAAKLEGRPTTDKMQRHMGEVMADF